MKLHRVRTGIDIGDGENGRSIGDMRFQSSKKEVFKVSIFRNFLKTPFLGTKKTLPNCRKERIGG